jgi:hypothetical protein
MTARMLEELEALESPREPLDTPQFTGGRGFFGGLGKSGIEDLMEEEPPNPSELDVKESSQPHIHSGVVRLTGLGIHPEDLSDLDQFGLQVDQNASPRSSPSLETLRSIAESAILLIKSRYLQAEVDLLQQLSPEEQELMQLTKPAVLMETRSEEMEDLEEIKGKWTDDVKALREEVEQLRGRVAGTGEVSVQEVMEGVRGERDLSQLDESAAVIVEAVQQEWEMRETALRSQYEEEKRSLEKGQIRSESSLKEQIHRELSIEYEEKLRKRLSQLPQKRPSEEIADLRRQISELEAFKSNVELDFEVRLATEKEAWKQEISSFALAERQEALEQAFEVRLAQRTREIQDQAKAEVAELAGQFRKEAQEAISLHLQRLAEDSDKRGEAGKQQMREECLKEIRSEREMKLAEALAARLTVQLDKELRRDLAPKIEKELRTAIEEQLRAQIRREFEDIFETRRNQLESELKSKLKNATERVEGRFEDEIARLMQEKTLKLEKDMKIRYKTKLEREIRQAQAQVLEEYKAKQTADMEEIRREKAEISRLKAALNVQMRKLGSEKKEETERVRKMELELEKKGRELSYQLGRAQEGAESSRQRQNTPPKPRESRISPEKFENIREIDPFSPEKADIMPIKTLPRPISPPKQARSAAIPEEEPRFLPRYDSEDLVKQLISRNLEEAQREAVSLLQQTEKPPLITSPYYPKDPSSAPSAPSLSYYPKEKADLVGKSQGNAPVYYRSREETRKEAGKETSQPQSARHQLYQELLKERLKQ